MGVYIWSRLPSEYQEVEWIGRNGNNYIDTGWIPKISTKFEVQIGYKISTSGQRYGIISNYNDTSGCLSVEVNNGSSVTNNKVRLFYRASSDYNLYSSNTLNTSSFNDIKITSNGSGTLGIDLNGTSTTGTTSGSYANASAYLFIDRSLRWTTFSNNSFISYCKIYENGTLVRDFIPCYRLSDSVIGLYDLVNNQFYTNSGSGTFTKGSDVDTYRESLLKNAYIGEYIPPKIEYSYDFRSKSTTTLSNDGWTWNNAPSIDSGGIYYNSWSSNCWKELGRTIGDAKKITLEIGISISGGNYAVGGHIGILNSTLSGFYIDSYPSKQFAINGTSVYDNRNGNNSGTYTITAVYDLVNKTYNVSSYISTSGSLTDAQIEAIRTYNSIRCMVANGGSRIQTVNLLVEY